MNNNEGALNFSAEIDLSLIKKAIKQGEDLIKNFSNNAVDDFSKLDTAVVNSGKRLEYLIQKNASKYGVNLNKLILPAPGNSVSNEMVKQRVIMEEAKRNIKELYKEIENFKYQQKTFGEGSKKWNELKNRIIDAKSAVTAYSTELETAKQKIKDLSSNKPVKATIQGIDKTKKDVENLSSTVKDETSKMNGYFKSLSTGVAAYFSLTALKGFTNQLIKVRGEFQQNQIAFEVMLQSKAKADQLMGELVSFASESPFGLQSSAKAAKQLLAYGSAAHEVRNELKMLGDVASGVSQPIGDLAYLYGTLRTQGRAYAVDIRQFAGRGIPIYEELAKVLKVNTNQINEMVEAGKVGFPEVQKALKNMSSEGGKFHNLMIKQTESLAGLREKLSDAVDVALNDIGTKTQSILSGGISAAAFLVENYEALVKVLTTLISTYGAYRAALMLVNTLQKANTSISMVTNVVNLSRATQGLTVVSRARAVALAAETVAQKALNAAMSVNPFVLITTTIVGLTATMWALHDSTNAQEEAQKKLNARLEEGQKRRENTSRWVDTINSQTNSIYAQVEAFNKLKALYPDYLRNLDLHAFKAKSAAEQQKILNKAMDDADVKINTKGIEEVENKIKELRERYERTVKDDKNVFEIIHVTKLLAAQEEELKLLKEQKKLNEQNAKEAAYQELSEKEKIKYLEEQKKILTDQALAILDNQNVLNKENLSHEKKISLVKQGTEGLLKQKKLIIETKDEVDKLGNSFSVIPSYLSPINYALKNKLEEISGVDVKLLALKSPAATKNKEYWKKREEEYTKLLEALPSSGRTSNQEKDFKEYTQLIKEARKELDQYNISVEKSSKRKTKTKKEEYPYGSLKYWEEVSRKIDDIISKTAYEEKNKEFIKKLSDKKIEADQKAEEIRFNLAIRGFDEELTYKSQQYSNYYKWIENLGKDSADKQFSDLLKNGNTFLEYLEKQKANIVNKGDQLTLVEGNQLSVLTDRINEIKGIKSSFEQLKDSIARAKDESRSLFEYVEKIAEFKQKLDEGAIHIFGEQKNEAFNFLNQESEKTQQDILNNLLANFKTFETQRKEIVDEAEKNILLAREKGYLELIPLIEKTKDRLIGELDASEIQGSDIWQHLFDGMGDVSLEVFKKSTKKMKEMIDNISDEEIKKNLTKQLDDYETSISSPLTNLRKAIKKYKEAEGEIDKSKALDNLKKAYQEFEENAIMSLKAVSNGLKDLGYNTEDLDKIVKGIEGGMQVISGIMSKNPAQIIGGAMGLISTLSDAFDRKSRKLQRRTKQLKSELAEIQRLFSNLEREVGRAVGEDYYSTQRDKIQNLQSQQQKLNELIANEQKKKSKKRDNGAIEDWKNQINDINNQIIDIQNNIAETLTQTNFKDVANQLADVFTTAFSEGKDAAKDFEKTFKQVIANSVKNALKLRILEPVTDKFVKDMSDYMGNNNNSLSGFDFDKWKSRLSEAGNSFTNALTEFENFFKDINSADMDPLSGAIKGVSEDTANLIAGQLNAIRMNQLNSFNLLRDQLTLMSKIEMNTFKLNSMEKMMSDMVQYIKSNSGLDSARAKGLFY